MPRAAEHRELDRGGFSRAVRVVVQGARGAVIDQPVLGVRGTAGPCSHMKLCCGDGHAGAERAEDIVIEAQHIAVRGEIGHGIDSACGQRYIEYEYIGTVAAVQQVVAEPAVEHVDSISADQGIVAAAAEQRIVARPAEQGIGAAPAAQVVIAILADQAVGADAAEQGVIAEAAVQRVRAARAFEIDRCRQRPRVRCHRYCR